MIISLFSGQGSQYPGMGHDITEAFPQLCSLYDNASDILGKDLKSICFDASQDELTATVYAQPAVMITSLVCLEAAKLSGFSFDAVAGHSLGEYAALVASGMVSFEDGFRLIKARSEAMDSATRSSKGTMCAILRTSPEKVELFCKNAKSGYVAAVNYNSPVQTVIAGQPDAVKEVSENLRSDGAAVVELNVAGAFHSQLMQPAAELFYETAKNITFHKPQVRFFSNVLGAELSDFSDIPSLLAKHIVSPVRFTDEMLDMNAKGFDSFYEFGPGKVLTGLVRKNLKGKQFSAFNVENLDSLKEVFNK